MTTRECTAVQTQLPEYLAGEADTATSAQLRQHLAGCADCRQALAELSPLIHDLNQLARAFPAPPAGLAAQALNRARAEAKPAGRRVESWRTLLRPTAVAGLAAAVLFALILARHPVPGRVPSAPGRPPAESEARLPAELQPQAKAGTGEARVMLSAPEPAPLAALDSARDVAPGGASAAEQPWVEVFAGASREASQVVSRLAAAGIRARQEPVGEGRAKVRVQPADVERSRQLIRAAENAEN